MQDELKHICLSQIETNPYQPRRDFDLEELKELAASICTVGLLHPPLVRPKPDSENYELISGERRFRAAQIANLTTIPVYIRKTDYFLSAQAALIENIQRVDLNPLEIAKALKRLINEFDFTQDLLAQKIGKKRSTVANYLRLLSLPILIQESLLKNCISMGHAKAILSVENQEKQLQLHQLILNKDLTVRQAEQIANQLGEKLKKIKVINTDRNIYLEDLSGKLRERFGTNVSIESEGEKGKITIDYYDLEDLDRLLTLFGIQEEF